MRDPLNGLVAVAAFAARSFHFRTMSSPLAEAWPDISPTRSTTADRRRIDPTTAPRRVLILEVIVSPSVNVERRGRAIHARRRLKSGQRVRPDRVRRRV